MFMKTLVYATLCILLINTENGRLTCHWLWEQILLCNKSCVNTKQVFGQVVSGLDLVQLN